MADKLHYFIRLIGTREDWPDDMTPAEERIMNEHFVYLKELTDQGKVLMAGPVFNPTFGLIVLEVDSEDEARQIMLDEPSIVQGVHTYQLQTMRVSLKG